MANFIRCKEDVISYQRMKKEKDGYEIKKVFFIFKKIVELYKEVPGT